MSLSCLYLRSPCARDAGRRWRLASASARQSVRAVRGQAHLLVHLQLVDLLARTAAPQHSSSAGSRSRQSRAASTAPTPRHFWGEPQPKNVTGQKPPTGSRGCKRDFHRHAQHSQAHLHLRKSLLSTILHHKQDKARAKYLERIAPNPDITGQS